MADRADDGGAAVTPGPSGGKSQVGGVAGLRELGSRYALLPLRIFLGVTFVYAGIDKLADAHYLAGAADSASFVAQTRAVRGSSPIGPLLDQALHTPTPFALAMAFGELAVGLGALLGLWMRVAGIGGVLINLSLWLTVSWQVDPFYLGNDLPYMIAWLPLVLAGAPNLSLDAWLAGRTARERTAGAAPDAVRRRALIDGGIAAVAVAGVGLLSGVLAAKLGRNNGDTVAKDDRTVRPGSDAAPSQQPVGANGAGGGAAKVSVPVAEVALGGAVRTADPATGDAVFVLQLKKDEYSALSAVCPHARCVVDKPKDGKLVCPCHRSVFDATTGEVLVGPAKTGLPKYGLTRSGDRLELGPQES